MDEDKKDPIQSEEPDQPSDGDEIRRVGAAQANFDPQSPSTMPTTNLYAGKKSGVSKPLILIFGIIVLLVIGATGYLLRNKFTTPAPTPSPKPAVGLETPVSEPSPTPKPFNRSKFTLRVLNGTKTSGLAASQSAKLKELGYQVSKTGNATSSAIAQTTIRLKSNPEGLFDTLKKDLSDTFEAITGKALDSDDDVDAEVTLGAK